jgi:hypothetical protein
MDLMCVEVVNLELELEGLRANLTATLAKGHPTDVGAPSMSASLVSALSSAAAATRSMDAASQQEEVGELAAVIAQKEARQRQEMRGVMRDWLKAVFVLQSLLSIVVCGLVSYDAVIGLKRE